MTILERIEEQKEFVEKTSVILDKLLNWQLEWVIFFANFFLDIG